MAGVPQCAPPPTHAVGPCHTSQRSLQRACLPLQGEKDLTPAAASSPTLLARCHPAEVAAAAHWGPCGRSFTLWPQSAAPLMAAVLRASLSRPSGSQSHSKQAGLPAPLEQGAPAWLLMCLVPPLLDALFGRPAALLCMPRCSPSGCPAAPVAWTLRAQPHGPTLAPQGRSTEAYALTHHACRAHARARVPFLHRACVLRPAARARAPPGACRRSPPMRARCALSAGTP